MFQTYPESTLADRFELQYALLCYGTKQYKNQIQDSRIMLCEGDAFIDGNLVLDWTAGWQAGTALGCEPQATHISGFIVTGNLTVAGAIINRTPASGPFLYVMGRLNAMHLVGGGSEIQVQGDVRIEEVLYAHSPDGLLDFDGQLDVPVLLNEGKVLQVRGRTTNRWSGDSLGAEDRTAIDTHDAKRPLTDTLRGLFANHYNVWADAVEAIAEGGSVLRPSLLRGAPRTADEWRTIIAKDPSRLSSVPEPLRDAPLCLLAVQHDGLMLQHVPDALRSPEICDAACTHNGKALRHVPMPLRTHALCLRAALKGTQTHLIPEAVLDEPLACALVRHHGATFSSLPARLQNDRTVAAAINSGAVAAVPMVFQSEQAALFALHESVAACDKLPGYLVSQSVFAQAQKLYGRHPEWTALVARHRPRETMDSNAFKTVWACFLTETLCMRAILKGAALYLIPRALHTPSVSQMAFDFDPFNFTWIPDAHKTQKMCEQAVQTDYGGLLARVPAQWLTPELCTLAVKHNAAALQHVPEALKTLALIATAVSHHPATLAQLPTAQQLQVTSDLIARSAPNSLDLRRQRAALWRTENNFAAAIEDFDAVLAVHPDDLALRFARATAHFEAGQFQAAGEDLLHTLERDPRLPGTNTLYAQVLATAGCADDMPDALEAYRRELKVQPENVTVLQQRATLSLRQNNPASAQSDLDRAMQLAPDNIQSVYLSGFCAYTQGNYPSAQAAYAMVQEMTQKMALKHGPPTPHRRAVCADAGLSSGGATHRRTVVDGLENTAQAHQTAAQSPPHTRAAGRGRRDRNPANHLSRHHGHGWGGRRWWG
jgi:tetratricopeptide (TPR) repeat protein